MIITATVKIINIINRINNLNECLKILTSVKRKMKILKTYMNIGQFILLHKNMQNARPQMMSTYTLPDGRMFPTKSYRCLLGGSHSTVPPSSNNIWRVNSCAVSGRPCKRQANRCLSLNGAYLKQVYSKIF